MDPPFPSLNLLSKQGSLFSSVSLPSLSLRFCLSKHSVGFILQLMLYKHIFASAV